MEDTMKKTVLILTAIALLLLACGKLKTFTPSVLTHAPGGPDNSTFPFETSADLNKFSVSSVGDNLAFTAMSISHDYAYMGSGSLQVTCNFTGSGNNNGGALTYPIAASGLTITGKTVTAYIWVPNGMFTSDKPYGCVFFVQLPSYDWYQWPPSTQTWYNLTLPPAAVDGIWNSVTARIDDMQLTGGNGTAGHVNGYTMSQNGIDPNTSTILGLKIGGQGTSGAKFSNLIYIDSINITDAGGASPSATSTDTPAVTPTETAIDTVILTATETEIVTATETAVDTAVETPTPTETPTVTETITETAIETPTLTVTATP
jgi:hypothetical protein